MKKLPTTDSQLGFYDDVLYRFTPVVKMYECDISGKVCIKMMADTPRHRGGDCIYVDAPQFIPHTRYFRLWMQIDKRIKSSYHRKQKGYVYRKIQKYANDQIDLSIKIQKLMKDRKTP